MKRKLLIICATRLAPIQGLLLFLTACVASSVHDGVQIFLVGSIILLLSLLVVKAAKRIFRKLRTLANEGLFSPVDMYAFPSGHAAGSFALTSFMLGENIYLGVISLIVSVIVVASRYMSRVHDRVDIVVGALLGVVIAVLFTTGIEKVALVSLSTIFPIFSYFGMLHFPYN